VFLEPKPVVPSCVTQRASASAGVPFPCDDAAIDMLKGAALIESLALPLWLLLVVAVGGLSRDIDPSAPSPIIV
jgi:hypothetical protein